MCDSFVALPAATSTGTTLAAKNADCEINEAQAVLRLSRRRYPDGAMLRATHIGILQARETHEIVLDKSYWTWGVEIGVNEHGLAVGNEAIFSRGEEKSDGLITGDLLRLMLERARICDSRRALTKRRSARCRPESSPLLSAHHVLGSQRR